MTGVTCDVTVVIPMYNADSTIVGALASVAGQTLQPQTVIVVDDGSTDGASEKIRSVRPEVQLLRLDSNQGAAIARNTGARAATTEWIAFLDADDVWEPTFLHEVCGALLATRTDFASSGGIREKLPPDSSITRVLNEPVRLTDRTQDFWRMALNFMPAHPSSMVVRRSLFLAVGGFPVRSRGEDHALWARLWLTGRFTFVNKPLFHWRQLPTGLTATARDSRYRDELDKFADLGLLLLRAVRRRRPGVLWFALWYARQLIWRTAFWLKRRVRRRG